MIFGFGQPKGIPPANYPGKASENTQYEIGVAKFENSLKLYQRIRALLSTMYTVFLRAFSNGKVAAFPFLNYSGFASFYFKFATALLAPPAFNPYFSPSSRLSV